jgi:hypothetical protein
MMRVESAGHRAGMWRHGVDESGKGDGKLQWKTAGREVATCERQYRQQQA